MLGKGFSLLLDKLVNKKIWPFSKLYQLIFEVDWRLLVVERIELLCRRSLLFDFDVFVGAA